LCSYPPCSRVFFIFSLHDALPILFYLGVLFKNDYFIKTAEEMTSRVLNQVQYTSAFSDWLLNDLIFKQDFEYIIIKQPTAAELKDRKSTRLNSSHVKISYAVFCLK